MDDENTPPTGDPPCSTSFPSLRSEKPRDVGVSHVMDKGLGLRQAEDLLAACSDYIDIVKLGWGTGYVTQNVIDKINFYSERGHPRLLSAARSSRSPSCKDASRRSSECAVSSASLTSRSRAA